MSLSQISALVAVVAGIGGGAWALDARYAKVEQVAANSEAIMLVKIDNALMSNQKERLRRLCDDFIRAHNWTPGACK